MMPAGIYPRTEIHREINKAAHKGQIPWNKGKHDHLSDATLQKMRESHIGLLAGDKHPLFGKPVSEETRRKLSISQKERLQKDPSLREAVANHARTVGMDPKNRKKLSDLYKGKNTGPNSPVWKGGISFEPYCPKFNDDFKERVREFWGRKCFICGLTEEDHGKHLHVHHVTYDKQTCCNAGTPLFIPLCHSCHSKTSHGDREGWRLYLTEQILLASDGICYLSKEAI